MLSSNKNNGSVIDISSHQRMLYGGCDISEALWQKGVTRGRCCCACLVFPAFPAPSSWQESDAWDYQGETQWWVSKQPSRVHHMFNKGSPMSQLWDTVSLFPGYSSVLRVAPGAREPYFAAIMLATCFPLIQFWLRKNEAHSTRSFYWKTSRGQISWWLLQTEKRGHAHTYARTDHWRGREGECFPHYCIRGAADELGLKITERKRQERGDHAGITNDINRGGVTTAEILCGGLYKIFTLCQSDELIQIRGKKQLVMNSWVPLSFLFSLNLALLSSHHTLGLAVGGWGGGGHWIVKVRWVLMHSLKKERSRHRHRLSYIHRFQLAPLNVMEVPIDSIGTDTSLFKHYRPFAFPFQKSMILNLCCSILLISWFRSTS